MDKIFSGSAPFKDGSDLVVMKEPRERYPIPAAPERPEEFAPGLDPELQELADALTHFKEKRTSPTNGVKKSVKKKN
jgi:Mn-containing catalase